MNSVSDKRNTNVLAIALDLSPFALITALR